MSKKNEKIELTWTPLTSISNIKNPAEPNRGIYCWGFTVENKFMPYYIGKAENISHRIFEHFSSLIGGKYTLFHKEDLLNFSKFKEKDPNEKEGKSYIPDWPKGYENFIKNRDNLKDDIDFMIKHMTYSYAIVDKIRYSKQELSEIEKKCIEDINIKNSINTRGGDSHGFEIEHRGDNNLIQFFK